MGTSSPIFSDWAQQHLTIHDKKDLFYLDANTPELQGYEFFHILANIIMELGKHSMISLPSSILSQKYQIFGLSVSGL